MKNNHIIIKIAVAVIIVIIAIIMFRHSIYIRSTGSGFFSSIFSSAASSSSIPSASFSSSSSSSSSSSTTDPYRIESRFVHQQKLHFDTALEEIQNGQKLGHWSWFCFVTAPFIHLGQERGSPINQYYALRDLPPNTDVGFDAARAFLRYPPTDGVNLRNNYVEMMTAIAEQLERGVQPLQLVGALDVDKLIASLKLMKTVSGEDGFDDEVHEVCCRCLKLMGV